MHSESGASAPKARRVSASVPRPSRRDILRLAAGTALAGVAEVLGLRPAYASACTDACQNWRVACHNWCYANKPQDKPCHQACEALYSKECLTCCYAGGSPDYCTPPRPPAKSTLVAVANDLFVSAELGYTGGDYGMLRARAYQVGPWEKYDILLLDNGLLAIRGANGLYVSAELGYTGSRYGMLRARASTIGSWEQFGLGDSFTGGSPQYTFKGANGKFVSAELGYTGGLYGMLRARASVADGWEQYYWIPTPA